MTKQKRAILAAAVIICAAALGGIACALYAAPRASHVPPAVLMYHLVREEPYNIAADLFVRPSNFEKQLQEIAALGIETVFPEDTGRNNVTITFDDGYIECYTNAYPLLLKYNVKATFFVISDLIGKAGYMSEDQLREMSDSGLVSIQSHTKSHRKLTALSDEELDAELRESKERIEGVTGREVYAISYPNGDCDDRVIEAASKYYTRGFTTKAPHRVKVFDDMTLPRRGVPRGDLTDAFLEYITRRR